MNFNWKIAQVHTKTALDGKTNVVIRAEWICNVNAEVGSPESIYMDNAHGWVNLTLDENSPFIEYQNLTEQDVLNWIWESGVDKSQIEASMIAKFNEATNPSILKTGLPWIK